MYGTACEPAEEPLWMGPLAPPESAAGTLVTVAGQVPECIDHLVSAFS